MRKDFKQLEKLQKSQEKIIQTSKNIEEETFVKKVIYYFFINYWFSNIFKQINSLANENNSLKEKIKELQEKLRIQEKNGIKQQERYTNLEQKYKDFQSIFIAVIIFF